MDMKRMAAALGLALLLGGGIGCRDGGGADGRPADEPPETGQVVAGGGAATATRVATPAATADAGADAAGRTPSERTIISVARGASPAEPQAR